MSKMSNLHRIISEMERHGRLNAEDIPEVVQALKALREPVAQVRNAALCAEGTSPLPNGCALYWHTNLMGNRVYSSDEIGGGVHVWDVTLVDHSTLLAAITKELELQTFERMMQERGERS